MIDICQTYLKCQKEKYKTNTWNNLKYVDTTTFWGRFSFSSCFYNKIKVTEETYTVRFIDSSLLLMVALYALQPNWTGN